MSSNENIEKIKKLNSAANKIKSGLEDIKCVTPLTPDISTHIWRIEKALKSLHSTILVEIKKAVLNTEFENIIKTIGDSHL